MLLIRNSAVALLKIKQLQYNELTINIYFCQYIERGLMIIAIPDIFWSTELPLDLTKDELHEELLMQLFNLYTENEADALARDISDWIATN
ncbi:YueH family protein [Staphylococcus capitis]|uniref:YueH family protein n=1 Tax=Staphylococcus capitis TaxID=29388 RepID=UPI0030BD2742